MSVFSDYLKEFKGDENLLEFKDDLFPLENGRDKIWTGFYTSKPRLKRKIRYLGKFMRFFKIQ